MADRTSIEWTDATVNPIRARRVVAAGREVKIGWHCEHVSEACRNCYAEAINRNRFGTGLDYKPGHLAANGGEVEIVLIMNPLLEMLRWRRPRRVFVCSMTDLFADFVSDRMIDRVFAAMALAPHHTFQLLTKRPERMRAYLTSERRESIARAVFEICSGKAYAGQCDIADSTPEVDWHDRWPLPNVWLGVTAEDQRRADERIPILLETPAAKRFVSVEPMLGEIKLTDLCDDGFSAIDALRAYPLAQAKEEWGADFDGECGMVSDRPPLDWVICGGESGPRARPVHPEWVRSLRDQCAAAGTPFLFKQWGEWGPVVADDRRATRGMRARPDGQIDTNWSAWNPNTDVMMMNIGKARAGRLLDGVEHNAFPEG